MIPWIRSSGDKEDILGMNDLQIVPLLFSLLLSRFASERTCRVFSQKNWVHHSAVLQSSRIGTFWTGAVYGSDKNGSEKFTFEYQSR